MKNNTQGMSLIVKTITRLTVGLVIIYGLYLILRGHISPGGSFAGGVIIALAFVQLMLAYGKDAVTKIINQDSILALAGIGAVSLLLANIFRAPIALIDLSGSIMVAFGLSLIFLLLVFLIDKRE